MYNTDIDVHMCTGQLYRTTSWYCSACSLGNMSAPDTAQASFVLGPESNTILRLVADGRLLMQIACNLHLAACVL